MKPTPAALCGVALFCLLAGGPSARADFINWSYSWSNTPDVIHADAPGTSTITLTDESLKTAVGNTDIVATNLRTFSTAPAETPDQFTHAGYTLTLFIKDTASGQSGTLTFTGEFNGALSSKSSGIKNTFTGQTTKTLLLGNDLYTVVMGSYSPPGPPGQSNTGSISAHASITVQDIRTPEPSGLVLGFLGVPLAAMAWRRRARPCTKK
jgi:hypothetical protein